MLTNSCCILLSMTDNRFYRSARSKDVRQEVIFILSVILFVVSFAGLVFEDLDNTCNIGCSPALVLRHIFRYFWICRDGNLCVRWFLKGGVRCNIFSKNTFFSQQRVEILNNNGWCRCCCNAFLSFLCSLGSLLHVEWFMVWVFDGSQD